MTQNNQESLIFSENPSLSRRQIRAIPFFVFARNIEEGSRNAKISRSCFKRWWRNEAFHHISQSVFLAAMIFSFDFIVLTRFKAPAFNFLLFSAIFPSQNFCPAKILNLNGSKVNAIPHLHPLRHTLNLLLFSIP